MFDSISRLFAFTPPSFDVSNRSSNNTGSRFPALAANNNFNPIGLLPFVGALVEGLVSRIVSPPTPGNSISVGVPADVAKAALPYLDLSDAAYQAGGAAQGWERLHFDNVGGVPLHDPNTGFDAEVFRNQQSGEVSIAFRGSEFPLPFLNDWIDDGRQVGGEHSPQFQHAIRLAESSQEVFGDNLSFTGHSLGGGLALAAGLSVGAKTYTFDALGLGAGTLNALGDRVLDNSDHITNIALEGEFVTDLDRSLDGDAVGQLVGDIYYASADGFNAIPLLFDNAVTRHAAAPLRESLQESIGIRDQTDDNLDIIQAGLALIGGSLSARHR